jgi:hypothetical protein
MRHRALLLVGLGEDLLDRVEVLVLAGTKTQAHDRRPILLGQDVAQPDLRHRCLLHVLAPFQPHPRVENRVKDVDRDIGHHDERRRQRDDRDDHWQILVEYPLYGDLPKPRQAEDLLGHHRAPELTGRYPTAVEYHASRPKAAG